MAHASSGNYLALQALQQVKGVPSLLGHLGDPRWEEAILRFVGEANETTYLLERLLSTGGPGEAPEDIFASKLILAGRFLATHPIIQRVQLWDEIPDRLFEQLLSTRYSLTRQQMADTLAEIGRAYPFERYVNLHLLTLLKENTGRSEVRSSIARALGEHGARELVPDLLTFFIQAGATLDDDLRETLSKAITKLAGRTLLQTFVTLVSDQSTNPLVAASLAYAIGTVGDTFTAAALLPLLSNAQIDTAVRAALAHSIGRLSDAATLPAFIALIASPQTDDDVAESALIALARRDQHIATPDLVAYLSQRRLPPSARARLAHVIGTLGDASSVDQLRQLAADSTLDKEIRAFGASAFARYGIRTQRREVLDMLADPNVSTLVRQNIAWALARLSDREMLADLRYLRAQEQNEQVRAAITTALGLLGEYSALPKIIELFLHGHIPAHLRSRVTSIIVQFTPTSVLIDVLTNAKAKEDAQAELQARVELARAPGAIGKSALVPELLTVLTNPAVTQEVRTGVAAAIGKLADQKQTVERLLELWRLYDTQNQPCASPLQDAIYRAMWTASRKTGVAIIETPMGYRVIDR